MRGTAIVKIIIMIDLEKTELSSLICILEVINFVQHINRATAGVPLRYLIYIHA